MSAFLAVRDVTKSFGGLRALDKVTLTVDSGVVRGLIGPNGAGKTTLVNVISGQFRPDSGTVYFDGQALATKGAHRIARAGIARIFQITRMFSNLNVMENVMVGCHRWSHAGFLGSIIQGPGTRREEAEIRDAALDALSSVGLAGVATSRPQDLPYGHQRLVEIARALASRATLLLLDEPAAGLSPDEIIQLMDLLRTLKSRGITMLLVEHKMEVVMGLCDAITVLSFGRKIAEGTPTEIQSDAAVIEAYLGDVNPC